MKKHQPKKSSKHLLWPLFILLFLTLGVFFTSRQIPKQQEIRSRAQDFSPPDANTPTPTPTPVLQGINTTINIAFSLPGNASANGNVNPKHMTRDVMINLYDTDTNSEDPASVPLFSIPATATFDNNPISPNYLYFIGKNINLADICAKGGKCVPGGKYQIAIKTYQSLRKVYKQNTTDFAGKIYEFNNGSTFNLNFGSLILGDIVPAPNGDNFIDAADISAIINCLGNNVNSATCVDKQGPDLNDDGVIDETDHTILTQSIQTIIAMGGLIPSPTQSALKKKPSPTLTPTAVPSGGNAASTNFYILATIFVIVIICLIILLSNKKFRVAFANGAIEKKEFYIKKKADDEAGKGMWLTLTDDNGQKLGHYGGLEVQEGFGHIKGEWKNVGGKKFIEVTDITWDEQR